MLDEVVTSALFYICMNSAERSRAVTVTQLVKKSNVFTEPKNTEGEIRIETKREKERNR
jgi:hypothetical protein